MEKAGRFVQCLSWNGLRPLGVEVSGIDNKCFKFSGVKYCAGGSGDTMLGNTRGSSPSTYNQRLCAIHAFFDYVMTEEPTYMEQCILILKIPSMVSPDPPAQYLGKSNRTSRIQISASSLTRAAVSYKTVSKTRCLRPLGVEVWPKNRRIWSSAF